MDDRAPKKSFGRKVKSFLGNLTLCAVFGAAAGEFIGLSITSMAPDGIRHRGLIGKP